MIPNLSGLISNNRYDGWQLFISYLYFVFTALMIWKGNIVLLKNIRQKFRKNNKGYFQMVLSYIFVNLFYSAIISMVLLITWQFFSNESKIKWIPLLYTTSVILVCVTLINNVYEIVLLRKEMETSDLSLKKVEIQKAQAEMEALKAHIDPHFIFNTLNTLSYLIGKNPESAKRYNETLAKVYRYVLFNKDNDLVFLNEELDFICNYFYLLKIRFDRSIDLVIDIEDAVAQELLVTPVSLQLLLENAIKHNYFSPASPLLVKVGLQSNFVTVINKVSRKVYDDDSTGIGLKNLKERFQLIMQKDVIIYRENNDFIVKLPVLKA
jgi:sensor histidine kinase YesM